MSNLGYPGIVRVQERDGSVSEFCYTDEARDAAAGFFQSLSRDPDYQDRDISISYEASTLEDAIGFLRDLQRKA